MRMASFACVFPGSSGFLSSVLKDLFLVGNIKKNDLVEYFLQHIRNGLIIDLINS